MTVEKESTDVLTGTTFDVYRYMLTSHKALGAREIQRGLKLSYVSKAQYHVRKLVLAGFVKPESGKYVIAKMMLQSRVRIGHFLIPKHFFYSLIAVFALMFELTSFRPKALYQEYVFSVIVIISFLLIFSYETFKVWRKGSL